MDGASETVKHSASPNVQAFSVALLRLRQSQGKSEGALQTILGYLERIRDHPRDPKARSVCLWEPAFRTHVARTDGGLQCLQAAGFDEIEKDVRGTPFLVMRRSSPQTVRELISLAEQELARVQTEDKVALPSTASGNVHSGSGEEAGDEEVSDAIASDSGALPASPNAAVSAADSDTSADDKENCSATPDSDEPAAASEDSVSVERDLVQQISSMISGLIHELELQGTASSSDANSTFDDSASNDTSTHPPSPPVHFRVYRSPAGGFPGFPSGGGLPFLPGGMGSGPGEDDKDGEIAVLERRIRAASLPQEAEEVADRELKRLRRMSPMHSEYSTLVDYLEWIADLPWTKTSAERLRIADAKAQLETDHFGMEKVKARIVEYLSVAKLKGDLRGSILCMLGPPGIGKTSLGKSIADSLQRDFYRISLGGVHSEAEVRGHRRTYVGAMPGLILQAIKKCGTSNCVIMLDEIDKLGRNSLNGDPSSALLEVLDPEQNQHFRDHFLNLPFNLSRVLFIATANELEPIPRPLRDRMEVIEMSGYTVEEKSEIALRHLLPKQRKQHGLSDDDLSLDSSVIDALISGYTREAGVRELDRQLAALCRSVAARTAEAAEALDDGTEQAKTDVAGKGDGSGSVHDNSIAGMPDGIVGDMTCDELTTVLGPPKFDGPRDNAYRLTKPGIVAGLAYTPVGGDLLYVEAEQMCGKGELMLTGQLGDVMQESARAARSWVRAHAVELGLSLEGGSHLLNATDLHIHFPAGAIPKDGPSAGVTITTAIVSLLSGRCVRPDLAMTGEVSLRGVVLPVGGIKEKVIAAHRAGMRTVILPAKNEKDLRDLPPTVLREMNFTLVKEVSEVLSAALLPPGATVSQGPIGTEGDSNAGSGGARPATVNIGEEPTPMPIPSVFAEGNAKGMCTGAGRTVAGSAYLPLHDLSRGTSETPAGPKQPSTAKSTSGSRRAVDGIRTMRAVRHSRSD